MRCVYLLQGEKNQHIYVGSTADVVKRWEEHNNGRNHSTKRYGPFNLVCYEAYLAKIDALERECKLKHHGSVIGHLKKRLKNSLSR